MKKCPKCNEEKHINAFNKNNKRSDGRQSVCRQCQKALYRKYADKNPKYYVDRNNKNKKILRNHIKNVLLNNPCECGESDLRCLDFDHDDPNLKKFTIAHAINRSYTLNMLKEEIQKCTIRCANCHRKKTADQFGYWSAE